MKGSIVGALGVIVILIVAGLVLFRTTNDEALAPTAIPEAGEDDFTSGAADSGQFLQTSPDAVSLVENSEVEDVVDDVPVQATGQEVVINIDETGFTPVNVTVSAGTAVRFVNNGQALHWPASDVHPTHEILPEFDANRGLATGESYSYTFTKAGTWGMHDHLAPSHTGTITVK